MSGRKTSPDVLQAVVYLMAIGLICLYSSIQWSGWRGRVGGGEGGKGKRAGYRKIWEYRKVL
jgi:hypothetical protein